MTPWVQVRAVLRRWLPPGLHRGIVIAALLMLVSIAAVLWRRGSTNYVIAYLHFIAAASFLTSVGIIAIWAGGAASRRAEELERRRLERERGDAP